LKSLLPSKIEESMREREGELKIKLKKTKGRGIVREKENFIKKNWRGGGIVRERERKSERERE
jgi:hypothetical protein